MTFLAHIRSIDREFLPKVKEFCVQSPLDSPCICIMSIHLLGTVHDLEFHRWRLCVVGWNLYLCISFVYCQHFS